MATTSQWRNLEGEVVTVTSANKDRFPGAVLVSAGRAGTETIWLYWEGIDLFLKRSLIVDVSLDATVVTSAAA